jgi:uncharacterized protein YcbX
MQQETAVPQGAREMLGSVASLWRYPVKSMTGEELAASDVTERGLWGDRAYALVDTATGKVASAKNPRKWPTMFQFSAAVVDVDAPATDVPPVRITFPDGSVVTSEDRDLDGSLSRALGRAVRFERAETGRPVAAAPVVPAPRAAQAEEYWPDMDGLDYRDTVTDFDLPEGTFFDCAVVHVLTTATLDRLHELYPDGRFDVRRFRPNLVVDTPAQVRGFAENEWIGRTFQVGDDVLLGVSGPCPRCVMTTLAQDDLPKDSGILRTAAQHNGVNVGVYAAVLRGGTIGRGDAIRLG